MAVVTLDPPSLEVRHRRMGVGLACSPRRGRSDWRAWTWARVRPRSRQTCDCQGRPKKTSVRKVETKPPHDVCDLSVCQSMRLVFILARHNSFSTVATTPRASRRSSSARRCMIIEYSGYVNMATRRILAAATPLLGRPAPTLSTRAWRLLHEPRPDGDAWPDYLLDRGWLNEQEFMAADERTRHVAMEILSAALTFPLTVARAWPLLDLPSGPSVRLGVVGDARRSGASGALLGRARAACGRTFNRCKPTHSIYARH